MLPNIRAEFCYPSKILREIWCAIFTSTVSRYNIRQLINKVYSTLLRTCGLMIRKMADFILDCRSSSLKFIYHVTHDKTFRKVECDSYHNPHTTQGATSVMTLCINFREEGIASLYSTKQHKKFLTSCQLVIIQSISTS